MNFIDAMSLIFRPFKPKPHRQTCWTYCDCGNELTADPDTTFEIVDELVVYTCGQCNELARFDFGPPCPIRIRDTPSHQQGTSMGNDGKTRDTQLDKREGDKDAS